MEKTEMVKEVTDILNKGELYDSIVDATNDGKVVVNLFWGDWKHEHLWLKHLMAENGYEHLSEEVTEENGSDCYSAEQVFRKVA